ncbi:opacity protein-like surface antigen [Elusimicrobium posterum]|uniref:hypothetical protein n=1 Tax=Elusimicrobium posterum TaxID=3116653 RepID=UPI003C712953
MKKVLLAAVLALAVAVPAMAATPVKVSLWDGIEAPKSDTVHGLELGIGGKSDVVKGVQLEFIKGDVSEITGVQLGIFLRANKVVGIQSGIVGFADNVTGMQWNFINFSSEHVSGAQIGLYNQANSITGLQLGFVNNAQNLDRGLQLGILNLSKNGWINPVMVFVNGKF